jgi:hypothetical protein
MQRDNPSRSSWRVGAVCAGVPLSIVLFVLTGSPAWFVIVLVLLVIMAVIWPLVEIRGQLAWHMRSVPLPSWPYWVLFGIAYTAFAGMIGTMFVGALEIALVCAVVGLVTMVAQVVIRSIQVNRALQLPRPPAPSPRHRRARIVGYAALALSLPLAFNFNFGYHRLGFVAVVLSAVFIFVLVEIRRRQTARFVLDILAERAASGREANDS